MVEKRDFSGYGVIIFIIGRYLLANFLDENP